MTLWFVLSWSVLRTIIISTLAVVLGRRVLRDINSVWSTKWRRAWIVAALIPLLVPELIVGFNYRLTAQKLTESVWGTELLYATVLLIRSCSVSILVLLLLPVSAVTHESIHSWRLLKQRTFLHRWQHLKLLVTGPWRSPVVSWCLTSLVTFQDFETAALIQVVGHPVVWTVWLFDANAGNQSLNQTLVFITAPLLIELVLLIPGLWLIGLNSSAERRIATSAHRDPNTSTASWTITATALGLFIVAGWPVLISLPELWEGTWTLLQDPAAIVRQQATTLGFSATAAAVSLSGAVLLHRRNKTLTTVIFLLPGLAGSLSLSLILMWSFQQPGLRPLWDKWFPMLLGQSLLMLPRAWVLVLVLKSTVTPEGLYSAALLKSGQLWHRQLAARLLWSLEHIRWLLAAAVLCHWCTWDVTTASILRPVSIEPVVTRLYQEMHFSRTESLTALSLATVAVPWLLFAVIAVIRRAILRLC